MGQIIDIHLKQPAKPNGYIYHYTGQNGLLGIVESKVLWASNLMFLNDSKEFRYACELTLDILRSPEEPPGPSIPQNCKQEIEKFIRNGMLGMVCQDVTPLTFVVSFSEEGDMLSQWRGYAPVGFSIGFAYDEILALARAQRFTLAPCIYDVEVQKAVIREWMSEWVTASGRRNYGVNRCMTKFFDIAAILKHETFQEEREWRLILSIFGDDAPNSPSDYRRRIKHRSGKMTLVPYVEFNLQAEDGIRRCGINDVITSPGSHSELAQLAARSLLGSALDVLASDMMRSSKIPYRPG